MAKFKVGDVVVIARNSGMFGDSDYHKESFGARGIVEKVNDNRRNGWGISYSLLDHEHELPYVAWHHEEALEFESVYNTPLYKRLEGIE